MRVHTVVLLSACVFALVGCRDSDHSPAADPAVVREEITGRLARHAEALAEADIDAALELYTEDAIVRPANMEPIHGHSGLRQFFSGWFSAMAIQDAAYATEELDVHAGTAYQIGTYTGTLRPHGGAPASDHGSFSIVWKRQPDGSWKYHRGIFNSALPAASTITNKGQ